MQPADQAEQRSRPDRLPRFGRYVHCFHFSILYLVIGPNISMGSAWTDTFCAGFERMRKLIVQVSSLARGTTASSLPSSSSSNWIAPRIHASTY